MQASAFGQHIRFILSITDLSLQANKAVERAAQIAATHRATLKLMVLSPNGKAPTAHHASGLAQLAQELGHRLGITVRTVALTRFSLTHVVQEARNADLVVISYQRERTLRALLQGQLADRLSRLCRCPVLVSKSAAQQRYERILVPVDLTPKSIQRVKLAWMLAPSAELALFHPIRTRNEAPLRSTNASRLAIKAYLHECMRYANGRTFWWTDSFDSRRNRVMTTSGTLDPARQAVIQQDHMSADLVLVGKRGSSLIGDFIYKCFAQRVVRWASSDVLLVPHDFQPSTRATARQRITDCSPSLPGQPSAL